MVCYKNHNPFLIRPGRPIHKRLDFLQNRWHYEAFKKDVLYGYVSIKKSKEEYQVIIDSETFKAETVATAELRSEKCS